MTTLHIVQGGIANKDKQWLEQAAQVGRTARTWVAPKSVAIGDEVVIYISGYGFFATGRIKSHSKARPDWPNRYGAALGSIRLIKPAISLFTIRRTIPKLTWAKYPRSITTPESEVAAQIRSLIRKRRTTGIPDLDDLSLAATNLDELRRAALLKSRPTATRRERTTVQRVRARAIRLYVLSRANGECEGCRDPAPFRTTDGQFYLEPHHTLRTRFGLQMKARIIQRM